MPVETLTQIQKNYVLMLLMGGDIPENEIRMFLARSGWSINEIDAGVLYSKDEGLMRTLSEARGMVVDSEAQPTTNVTPNTDITISPSLGNVSSTNTDPYRETAQEVAQDFSLNSLSTDKTAMSTLQSLDGIKQTSKTVYEPEASSSVSPLMMTMPPTPPTSSTGKAILSTIAWLLFVLLIVLVGGVLGYMYYTGTGIFGDVIYNKLNLNA
jgi:hypothetical protein